MIDRLEAIRREALEALARAQREEDLVRLRSQYLGRAGGVLTQILRELGGLPAAERAETGRQANELKRLIEEGITRQLEELRARGSRERVEQDRVDITLPGRFPRPGAFHPVRRTLEDIVEIFRDLGFGVAEGPEVELDRYNFELLNFPPDHPARDMQDTFYLDVKGREDVLLRTHTSPVQVRVMEHSHPPIRVVLPGRVFRRDSDPTHAPMFHQVEGLLVDEGVSFSHLKGVLSHFARRFFGPSARIRFRPSFFPFTEPSAEVDVSCVLCSGRGCRVCKGTGWLEVLGCGMVHPNVFRGVGYDPEKLTGFAFGMGVERFAMLRWAVDDLRLFLENDLRFLQQF